MSKQSLSSGSYIFLPEARFIVYNVYTKGQPKIQLRNWGPITHRLSVETRPALPPSTVRETKENVMNDGFDNIDDLFAFLRGTCDAKGMFTKMPGMHNLYIKAGWNNGCVYVEYAAFNDDTDHLVFENTVKGVRFVSDIPTNPVSRQELIERIISEMKRTGKA